MNKKLAIVVIITLLYFAGRKQVNEAAQKGFYAVGNMAKKMRMSAAGLAELQQREGLRLSKYRDSEGNWTIGYGHLIGLLENYNNGITAAKAAALLKDDVATAENAVAELISVALTQNQFDALTSFVFNVGVSAFKNSTLLKMLNAGDYQGASEQMTRWVYVNKGGVKVVDAGLQNRRNSEMYQFSMGSVA